MVKAVHRDSRELDIVRYLSAPAQQCDPMNHCIRKLPKQIVEFYSPSKNPAILDLIDAPQDNLCFIVMEEWSANMFPAAPISPGCLMESLRHCIEAWKGFVECVYHTKKVSSSISHSCIVIASHTLTSRRATSSRIITDVMLA